MSLDPVRVGFIGAGRICRRRHLPGLARIDGVEVVAVCNRSPESSREVAAEFDIPEVEKDWQKLIARDDVDAIFIGTWPYMHKELSIAALEAGKHCFCQARMCMNLDEARQMLAAAQAHPHLVNMISPCIFELENYLRDMIQSGRLGQLTSIELHAISGANLDAGKIHWRERVEYSGRQVMSLGIYAEMLNAMLGPYARLAAQVATPIDVKTDERSQPVRIEVPQVVTITGQLESGALAIEHHSGLAVDQSSRGSSLILRGLEGTARYDLDSRLEFAGPGEELAPVDVPEECQRHWRVEEEFIKAVRAARQGKNPAERPIRPDFAEGVQYMRKIEAVHLSAATGQAVELAQL